MVVGFGSIKSGPILEYPLVEHNDQRQVRPIYMNIRKVKGKRGWLLRRIGHYIAQDPSPEGLGHHAIQVGDYAYELHTDEANQKYLLVQRLTGNQIWAPNIGRNIVGYCDFTDDEVATHAMRVQSWMRGREGGRYHVKRNNCQHFVGELWSRLLINSAKDAQNLSTHAEDHNEQLRKSDEKVKVIRASDDECSSDMTSLRTLCND